MTRFKESKRIEAAIKHKNNSDLLWAQKYCQSRLSTSTMKEHKKHWNKLINTIENVLSEIENE